MSRTSRMHLGVQAANCTLCYAPIDFASGFFFEVEDGSGAIAHPDCMAYFLSSGDRPTRGVVHTCEEPRCIEPKHLIAVRMPQQTCRQDGWLGRPDYVIGCTPDEDIHPWAFDHFHAVVDGSVCECRHESGPTARSAHGLPVD